MTPFAYKIKTSSGRELIKPTIESVLSYLKETNCPAYYAIWHQPVVACYPDDTIKAVDFISYTEPCEPSEEVRTKVEKEIDEIIEDNEKRWAELVAKTKPGERPMVFSGQFTLFRKDREMGIERALAHYRVKWKDFDIGAS